MFDGLWQDVRYAVRSLRRARAFTTAAVLTLALGIALTTAVYSVVDAVLVEPIPFDAPDRLVVVWETDRDTGTTREPASLPDFEDFRTRGTELSHLGAFVPGEVTYTPDGGDPRRLARLSVTGTFHSTLGVTPLAGRTLTDADDRPGGADVVVIGEQLWHSAFGRRDVIGRTMTLNGQAHEIVGVLPQSASFGVSQILNAAAYGRGFAARDPRLQPEVWLPLRGSPEAMPRATHGLMMLGRLHDRSSIATAQQQMERIASDLERAYPENQARGAHVESFRDVVLGPVQPALVVLLVADLFLLLIACVNVSNLLLARASGRAREVAVRAAIGAGFGRLARQFLVESVLLTAVAAAAGILLASAGLRVLLTLAPAQLPRLAEVSIDVRVLLVIVAVCAALAALFGLVPLVLARRSDLRGPLQTDAMKSGVGARHARTRRSALVIAEVALAVALVIAAGLLLRTVGALQRVDPGFDTSGVLKAEFQLPPTRYPIDMQRFPAAPAIQQFNDRLIERVSAVPGVEAVALAGNQPLDVGFTNSFVIVGREREAGLPEISIRRVAPGYLDTVKLRLVSGRGILPADTVTAPAVVLLNEAAAARLFPTREPIGQQIAFWGTPRRIVGVVANEKFHGLTAPSPIAVYAPLAQAPSIDGSQALIVRASGDVRNDVRAAIRDVDPLLSVVGLELLDETVANSIREQRFLMQLLGVFAAVALILAAVGIHGVLAYTLAQRTREFGVRLALGASRRDIVSQVLGQSAQVTLAGLAGGLFLGLALAQWLRGWLYGVTPADPMTIGGVLLMLAGVAMLSSYVPTRRAARIDPAVALRTE